MVHVNTDGESLEPWEVTYNLDVVQRHPLGLFLFILAYEKVQETQGEMVASVGIPTNAREYTMLLSNSSNSYNKRTTYNTSVEWSSIRGHTTLVEATKVITNEMKEMAFVAKEMDLTSLKFN